MSKIDETALAPCPFCGGSNVDPTGWASKDSAGPACDDCGASAGKVGETVEQNVAAWNRRAVLPAEPVALPYVVQYRLKGHWRWQDMAAFDNERIAENYRDECAKGRIPWEYQVVTRTAIRSSLIAEAGEPVDKGREGDGSHAIAPLPTPTDEDVERMHSTLSDLVAFVGVVFGRGPEATIPEEVATPLGVPIRIGAIMRDARAAIAAFMKKEG